MFSLASTHKSLLGDLWFVIPDHLQSKVVPFLKSKLSATDTSMRNYYYHEVLSPKAIAINSTKKYGKEIYMYMDGTGGYFRVYTCNGQWRTGICRPGPYLSSTEHIKLSLLSELENFRKVVKSVTVVDQDISSAIINT